MPSSTASPISCAPSTSPPSATSPGPGEVAAWQNSLMALSMLLDQAELNDHGVILEYQLGNTSRRLDAMLTGHSAIQRRGDLMMGDRRSGDPTEIRRLAAGNRRRVRRRSALDDDCRRPRSERSGRASGVFLNPSMTSPSSDSPKADRRG